MSATTVQEFEGNLHLIYFSSQVLHEIEKVAFALVHARRQIR